VLPKFPALSFNSKNVEVFLRIKKTSTAAHPPLAYLAFAPTSTAFQLLPSQFHSALLFPLLFPSLSFSISSSNIHRRYFTENTMRDGFTKPTLFGLIFIPYILIATPYWHNGITNPSVFSYEFNQLLEIAKFLTSILIISVFTCLYRRNKNHPYVDSNH
jgi:hypothetical protein